jgi:hypothetical protein
MTDAQGNPKYTSLGSVVKMALSIAHGQADVERGFSINKQVLESRTELGQQTLIGLRTVKDVVSRHKSLASIPITPSLLMEFRNAHKSYKEAIEKQKMEKSQAAALGKRKLPIEDASRELKAKKKEWEDKQTQAEKLVSEGTERLSVAVKSGKLTDILPAQALLESGNKLLKECRCEIENINKQLEPGQHQPAKAAK